MRIYTSLGLRAVVTLAALGFLVASITVANAVDAPTDQNQSLSEIIVTAEKHEEKLQNVPVPVTVVSADALTSSNLLGLQDFYNTVPGLTFAESGTPFVVLAIRGITTGDAANPTVGITVDDIPFGSSTYLGGGPVTPDFDPSDLARIEVLRGPQGTLYGASSIGGLIKYVTVDPSTEAVSGRVEASGNGVVNGGQAGYNFRAAINLPLNDTMAVRVSGFVRQDPGYIDNDVQHIDGINKTQVYGGHLSFLWRPSDEVSLKVSALYQDLKQFGTNEVDTSLGTFQQNFLPGLGGWETKEQAYSAILKVKLGDAEITSLSGFNISHANYSVDESLGLGFLTSFAPQFFGAAATDAGIGGYNNGSDYKFSQELRLFVPLASKLDLLVGGFYTHEYAPSTLAFTSETAAGENVGYWGGYDNPTRYSEYAGFANFTYKITDNFDVQFGGRESRIEQDNQTTDFGVPFDTLFTGNPSPSVVGPNFTSSSNAFTYLVTPRLKLSPDLMLYVRLASGYEAGGVNAQPGVPPGYSPSKTQDYEVGFKGNLLDHALSFDASIFYIDWKNLQLFLDDVSSQFFFTGNAGTAKSQGVELSVQSKPARGLTIGAWFAYDNAVLTSYPTAADLGGNYAYAGDRLPFSPRYSGNVSLDQEFPLAANMTGFVGGTVSYVGNREGSLTSTALRQVYPSYTQLNLRGGIKIDAWTMTAFINNLTDRRGVIGGGPPDPNPFLFGYIRPRTAGLIVSRTF
jgi:iron complex outermembrane receptor protein